MPHIHKLIDFTVNAFIVHDGKVLLVDHKKLKSWVSVGGHVELDEDPEEALLREVKEECGLEVEIVGERPNIVESGVKPLLAPAYMDIHNTSDTHRHVGLVYFAKAKSDTVQLAEKEHNAIRWFSREDLEEEKFAIRPSIRFYAEEALKGVRGSM